jgi:hypothetical protein
MNVEIGAEAAIFPEKEHINGIAVAVWLKAELGEDKLKNNFVKAYSVEFFQKLT